MKDSRGKGGGAQLSEKRVRKAREKGTDLFMSCLVRLSLIA